MSTRRTRIASSLLAIVLAMCAVAVVGVFASPSTAFAATGTQQMHRLYNQWTGEHFYTASTNERDSLVKVGWAYEGVGWTAPSSSSTPVYRLYNPYVTGGDHHYTTNASERDALVEAGWSYEGVGWYSDDAEGVPLYRQYNPYAKTGTHNYTADKNENDTLVKLGWRAEGIGWYGVKGSTGGSQGSTGGSQGSGTSGSGSSNQGDANDATPRYSYEAYYIDGMGSTWYSGVARTLYIKTDNPNASFSLKDPLSSGMVSYSLSSGDYADVADQGQVGSFLKVPGGYLVSYAFSPDTLGEHTMQILELDSNATSSDGTVAATFTANFVSYEDAQNKWADDAIARYTTPDMNPLEKLDAVCDGLGDEFRYYPNYGGYILNLASLPNSAPYFATKRWNSYVSPAALCVVAERIGGFSVIDNCYDNWSRDDPMWSQLHASVRVVYNGEECYFDAYPSVSSSSGRMDPSSIVKLDFNSLSSSQFQRA